MNFIHYGAYNIFFSNLITGCALCSLLLFSTGFTRGYSYFAPSEPINQKYPILNNQFSISKTYATENLELET